MMNDFFSARLVSVWRIEKCFVTLWRDRNKHDYG